MARMDARNRFSFQVSKKIFFIVSDDFLINADGTRSRIECLMYRGEKRIWQSRTKKLAWQVDGFASTDHGNKVFEYMGERFHRGCPRCHSFTDPKWAEKKQDILKLGY